MEITRHTNYCSKCKVGKAEIKHSVTNGTRYYNCRKCNAERAAAYRKTKKGAENIRKAVYRSIAKHPEKQKARLKLHYEIRMGRIKKEPCNDCGESLAQAHHTDYSKPLEVTWLCRICHSKEHKNDE